MLGAALREAPAQALALATMKTLIASLAFFLALPGAVFAHASPTEYLPASSATVTEAPAEIVIRFSERPEDGASRIVVTDETGAELQQGRAAVSADDAHVLSVPVAEGGKGAYFVSWSVVSKDDGHFTKGGFTYFIGDAASAGEATAPQVEVVQLSALPEAFTIAVELMGNSLLLAALALFALMLRPRMNAMSEAGKRAAARVHSFLAYGGAALALSGAAAHIALKTSELASLNGVPLTEALMLFLGTVSGNATLIRASAVILFAILFFFRARAIRAASRITLSELALAASLAVFAYFRAMVSHATANPFLPELGLATNFIHLVAKDLSAGLLVGLCAIMLAKPLREHLPDLVRRGMHLLALLFAPLAATAAYIVWLHLKDFGNLTASLWGERAAGLFASAAVAALLLAYHAIGSRRAPGFVGRNLRYTLPAEAAAAVLIVFFSSLMIITSPPLHGAPHAFREVSNGAAIMLSAHPSEDGMALLRIESARRLAEPVVILDADAEGGIIVEAQERYPGGYAFPAAVLQGQGEHRLSVRVAQEGGYDARAEFALTRADLALPGEGERPLDPFAAAMALIGVAGIAFALAMAGLARRAAWEGIAPATPLRAAAASIAALLVLSQAIGGTALALANPFKKECAADGNMWHLMLPTREGKPVSSTPAEGCMALNGAFHIADAKEYRFLKNPQATKVEFSTDLSALTAGVPATLAFSIRNEDGTAPRLVAQHERLIHVIVISKDATEFFHVHPDDDAPFAPEETAAASFEVPFTFPKAGEYVIGIDYASGLSSRAEQFRVTVGGVPQQAEETAAYPLRGAYDGYDLALQPGFPRAGEVATLVWRIQKNGVDLTDLQPYLGAAMHVAIVKDDLSEFVHAHGEVHTPGAPAPALPATGVHNHAPPPPKFGPMVEAHPVFPSSGVYTVFAQFKHDGAVVNAPFTVRVE